MLPPDELLEVRNGKVRIMNKQTMRELLKRSPDRADALCLTFAENGGFLANCQFDAWPGVDG
jgi:hypothetical protein